MDMFSSFRWKAANALTESLSKEERSAMLRKLDAVDETVPEKKAADIKATIGEAIAAAKLEELQRLQSKWDKDKDALMAEAEAAARDRIENDLRIQERRLALEQWTMKLEAEKRAEGQLSTVVSASAPTTDTERPSEHPLLGAAVADLGYKRIHLVSAKALSTIPVWKEQRIYRHDRAKIMAKDKLKSIHLGMPGVIVLHEDQEGKLSILDGQHRVGCMTLLDHQNNVDLDLERILVEVFASGENDYAEEIFTEINKAEPIKLIDMPGVASKGYRKIINDAAEKLQEQYSEMFKPSQSCRAPHINVDNLRDALFAAEVIKKHNLKTSNALVEWIDAQNKTLGVKFQNEEVASKLPQKALEKARQYEFYLGMGDSTWLYN
jgi:hypothetical protein